MVYFHQTMRITGYRLALAGIISGAVALNAGSALAYDEAHPLACTIDTAQNQGVVCEMSFDTCKDCCYVHQGFAECTSSQAIAKFEEACSSVCGKRRSHNKGKD